MPSLALGLGFSLGSDQGSDRRERRKKKKPELRHSRSGGRRRRNRPDGDAAVVSELSFSNLAGCEGSGLDPDLDESDSRAHRDILTPTHKKNPPPRSQGPVEDREEDVETLDPANHSFSLALRECQNERLRSETPKRKPRRQRPASLDLNGGQAVDVAPLSPRILMGGAGGTKKSSAVSSIRDNRSTTFLSPGTPNYRQGGGAVGYQKGWSSERVPLSTNCNRRYLGVGALAPFNNGRTLPSKWEDAEKWICSPVSGDGGGRSSVPPPYHRRPKSKSGPLGAPAGISGNYSSASPLVLCFDNGRVGGFAGGSPFLTGVMVADRGCCGPYGSYSSSQCGGGCGDGGGSFANAEPCMVRSSSLHGCSDALVESSSSLPSSQGTVQDGKHDRTNTLGVVDSPMVPRKDVATQMSPNGSTQSSPKRRPSLSPSTLSTHPIEELETNFSKIEVRDVQVDDCVTVTRWSKKHTARGSDKRSTNTIEWKKKTVVPKDSAPQVADKTKCISNSKRDEAKITAWENLQKAKAEAAIRKVEVKLEKKRSSSMVKILNKLRSAQKKAEEMRSAATATRSREVTGNTKRLSYFCKTGQISSLSGCFTCHAF